MLRFRDGFVLTVGLTLEIKLRFHIPSARVPALSALEFDRCVLILGDVLWMLQLHGLARLVVRKRKHVDCSR